MPAGAARTSARPRAAHGVLRALTRHAALRCVALVLFAFALGTEVDLREIASRLHEAAGEQAALAAAIRHCDAKQPASPRPQNGPASPLGEAALLVASLSLSAPLIVEPPLLAPSATCEAATPIGHGFARAPPPPAPHAHRSRAPPSFA